VCNFLNFDFFFLFFHFFNSKKPFNHHYFVCVVEGTQ
jgi:hypothetical protein